MTEVIKPTLTFEMFQAGTRGGVLAARVLQQFFGPENYRLFREAGRKGEDVARLDGQRVDREIYAKVGESLGLTADAAEGLWKKVMQLSNSTINYARGVLFADQERQASLINNIAWDEGRPSSALQRLTLPTSAINEQLRYEQIRQLGLALICAEGISEDPNDESKRVLTQINNLLEGKLFIGRQGDIGNYSAYSYHTPRTNKVIGISNQYPDPKFQEGLWVKHLNYPVRKIGIRGLAGEITEPALALYDPREKGPQARAIKVLQRSLKTAGHQANGGLIEYNRYGNDQLGFRLVVMQGEHPLRDRVTATLEDVLRTIEGVRDIKEDDQVNLENGDPQRVQFRRRQVYIEGLKSPLEVIVQTVSDFISYLYEVGQFNPDLGMHDGPAWDLYKLKMVAGVAEYLWPPRIFGIDLAAATKESSYQYAARLGTKQRIYPSPYGEES